MGEINKRNKPCSCGSGNKYKKCCIYRDRDFPDPRVVELHSKTFKKARPKLCLMKDFGVCDRVIKAHAIQRNGPLKDISSNGMIMGFNHEDLNLRSKFIEIGLRKASTFKGICDRHDKIFSDIENQKYEVQPKQAVLLSLRGVLYELYKKHHVLNQHYEVNQAIREMGGEASDNNEIQRGLDVAINSLSKELEKVRQMLMCENYDEIAHYDVLFQGRSNFVTSTVFGPLFNMEGTKRINDFSGRVKPLFLNIFNCDENTQVVFSWFKTDSGFIDLLINDLKELDIEKRKEFINCMMVNHRVENVFINPDAWNRLPFYERSMFENLFFHRLGDGFNFSNYMGQKELNLFNL